ncbi:UNKNOWN [Stylonychia lemnae]|uniref:Uncharacterized protein n=1 Tax=Stylonychia lemnae TaxID=5949 RepID=A0A078B0H8_STYLE|nr:UNKNOWN [Stylonychia lemnae]|eukprot:CDW87816.1 UNKNOWN [Stylonychia lemnae]
MQQKQLEQVRKDYPAKIKTDNAAITALQKALAILPKSIEGILLPTYQIFLASKKDSTNLSNVLGKIDQTQEMSPNFLNIYQAMRTTITSIQELQTDKGNRLKEVSTALGQFSADNTLKMKEMVESGETANSFSFLHQDFQRIQKHKEMKEHAKQFEIYCKLFEDTQTKINTIQEFAMTMDAGNRYKAQDLEEFLQLKMKQGMAADMGNQFRGGHAPPRSQSQQRTPQRMMGNDSNPSSAQRGRSEAPPEVGRR